MVTRSTDAGVSQRTNVWAERQMLKQASAIRILDQFGLAKSVPKNKGVNVKYRRPRVFTAATTPLVEGITPSASTFGYDDVSVALKQYGMLAETTDVIEDTHEDPVLNDMSEQAGENLGRTAEALDWGILQAGTNVFYANGTGRTAVNTPISLQKQRAVIRGLKAQKAAKISKVLDGSVNFKTRPVEAAYVAVCHTDVEQDIRGISGFTPVAEYGSRQAINEYELGSVEDVRYVASPDLTPIVDAGGAKGGSGTNMVSTAGTSADVYPVLVIGKDAYGIVALRGAGAIEPTILRPGVKDKSDPLGQRGYVGWLMWHAAVILNQLWMARLEVAVTDLA